MEKEIEKTNTYKRLVSDENIYLAIYSLESYIFNKELLSDGDKELLNQLRDKFNEKLIGSVTKQVKKVLRKLATDENSFIEASVYFKPKKYNEKDEKIEFRPLHTTRIVQQIAAVSILNLFIYEPYEKNGKLVLSNISRLIPENFYGNRVSTRPEVLFKPWKTQYKKYTQIANDLFKTYHETREYNYEVDLDLEDFFPSVNIRRVYRQILDLLPVTIQGEERNAYKALLIKLLVCKIDNLGKNTMGLYYRDKYYEGQTNYGMGIAQGLPQSYFLGNICMIEISRIFEKYFPGKSLFYVDDSVIFCNDISGMEDFTERLNKINEVLKKFSEDEEKDKNKDEFFRVYNNELTEFLRSHEKNLRVHDTDSKSTYSDIGNTEDGEIHLRSMSREVSQVGMDLYSNYSDEEDSNLIEKMSVLLGALTQEEDLINKKLNEEISDEKKESLKAYLDKLPRYRKFFKYRKLKMEVQTRNISLGADENILVQVTEKDFLKKFADVFKHDIWSAYISMYMNGCGQEEREACIKYVEQVNEKIFGFSNTESSYIMTSISDYMKNEIERMMPQDPYETLEKLAYGKYIRYGDSNTEALNNKIAKIQKWKWETLLSKTGIFTQTFLNRLRLVEHNTSEIKRMTLNAVYSCLFNVRIDDQMMLAKENRKSLVYGELRVLALLRNRAFSEEYYALVSDIWKQEDCRLKIDYAIMEDLDAFKQFVREPVQIDHLIKIHQYTCDVWTNGSKYLYFYSLHNQEHAIELVKNIIKLIKAIDYLQISATDYYMLFAACYLHDISMVKIPSADDFLLDHDKADEISIRYLEKVKEIKDDDIKKIKNILLEFYKKIDGFYEMEVRSNHASDSAREIRGREELKFLEECLREKIAEIAYAHGQNAEDIYKIKSNAKNRLVSTKFDKILLRMADVLDMSDYRVSKPILNHNVEQMSEISAFHWISHLMTKGYSLQTQYRILDKEKSAFLPKQIEEKLIFKIDVEMSQLSKVENKEGCPFGQIDQASISDHGFTIKCNGFCDDTNCNFLCKWFMKKNAYLIEELSELRAYLNRTPDNFFKTDIEVQISIVDKTKIDAKQFEILNANI